MSEITKIEKQKKNKQRYNIFLDGEFAIGIDEDTLLRFGLLTGDEITKERLNEISEHDEVMVGKKIAYAYISYKQRSKSELVKKLKQKKISVPAIDKIVVLLENQKYLNDESYAKNYLESKINRKSIGRRLLEHKLSEKGIDKEIVKKIIDENYAGEKESELAIKLLKKYEKKNKSEDEFVKKQKIFRHLASRGFDFDLINKIIEGNSNEQI